MDDLLSSRFGGKDVVEYLLQNETARPSTRVGGLIPLHNACSFGHGGQSALFCDMVQTQMLVMSGITLLSMKLQLKEKIDVCIR